MVLAGNETGTLVSIIVDSSREDAWKADPFYSDIKTMARQGRWRIQVLTPKFGWVIFPEEDLFLGERKQDDLIVAFGYKRTPLTRQPTVTVRHGDGSETEVLGQVYSSV
jgi:hypothetical protein